MAEGDPRFITAAEAIQRFGGGGSGITNSASNNVVTKSDGTNLVSSRITDDGTTITAITDNLAIGDLSGGDQRTQILLDVANQKVSLGDPTFFSSGQAIIVDNVNNRTLLGDINDNNNDISLLLDDLNEIVGVGDIANLIGGAPTPAKNGTQIVLNNDLQTVAAGDVAAHGANRGTAGAVLTVDSSNSKVTVGFYEPKPSAPTAAAGAGGTNLLTAGVYRWKVTFVTPGGETLASDISNPITVNPATQAAPQLSSIPIGSAIVTARKIYRTVANDTVFYKFAHTLSDNTTTTYTDNTPDASLGATVPIVNTAFDVRLTITPTAVTPNVGCVFPNVDPHVAGAGYWSGPIFTKSAG